MKTVGFGRAFFMHWLVVTRKNRYFWACVLIPHILNRYDFLLRDCQTSVRFGRAFCRTCVATDPQKPLRLGVRAKRGVDGGVEFV